MASYSESGVDIDTESKGASILFDAAKETWKNRSGSIGEIISPFDDFSGVRAIDVSALPKGSLMCMGFDGIGTKAEIAQRMKKHDTIAFDLLAMVCDDSVLRGGEPVLVGSVLDVNTLGDDDTRLEVLKQLAEGYVQAAKDADVAIINGELAQLGSAVGGYGAKTGLVYNWAAAVIWFAKKERLFTGDEIEAGDSIVMFKEKGFRSNGLSLVRKIFSEKFGDDWHLEGLSGDKLGDLVLEPSRIYSKAIVRMHGGFDTEGTCTIHGTAHITGGGVPEKLGRVLRPSGLGADLGEMFEPCEAMLYCQRIGKVDDREAYRTWNMGQGMAVFTPEPDKVISEAKRFGIDAKVAGLVVKEKKITIKSKGVFSNGDNLLFDL